MKPEEIYRGFQDHAKFCRESLTVETEGGKLVPLELGPGQLRLRGAIKKQRDAGRPVRVIFLKSRRIQATTGTAAEYFHGTVFQPGMHSLVMAHDAKSSEFIFAIYKRFHELYRPFGGVIRLGESRALADRIFYEFGGDPESSWIHVHTAGSTAFGRGTRFTNVHFSEYPYYPDPAQTRAAVMSCVPKLPDTCVVIEGTAKTIGDDFHKMWQAAYDRRDSEFEALFMGWWEHPSNRMRLHIPGDVFQERLSHDELAMMRRLRLDLEQMAWWKYTLANDFNWDIDWFRREHPASPEEAFMASSRTRFSIPHVMRMPEIEQPMVGELQWDEIGEEKRLTFVPNERGALRVYRTPQKGRFYACGADPSGGADINRGKGKVDPDWAVAHIFERETGEQCAALRLRCMPGEFGRYVYRLVRWYNNAQLAVERNGAGIGSLEAIVNEGYPTALIYHRAESADQDPQVRSDKIGWNTDEVSRQQMLSLLDEAIRAGSIWVHDGVTKQELLTFVINDVGKAEGAKGCHDDTVLALGLVVVVMAKMPMPRPPKEMVAPRIAHYGGRVETESRGRNVRVVR